MSIDFGGKLLSILYIFELKYPNSKIAFAFTNYYYNSCNYYIQEWAGQGDEEAITSQALSSVILKNYAKTTLIYFI